MRSCRAHTTYRTESGRIVPGVTTILGIINKPQLIKWANNLGLRGIDSTKYVDETARVGTLAHAMIQEYLGGFLGGKTTWNRGDYTPNEIDLAENALIKFLEWEKRSAVEPVKVELPLVSELRLYGGTIDFYGRVDGRYYLIDFKTSAKLYVEHSLQVAAYWNLLREHGYKIDGVKLLRIGRDNSEGFEDKEIGFKEVEDCFFTFSLARELYEALRILKTNGGS